MTVMAASVEAAGAVLWRQGERELELALVHRPKYDDWSLPKGKLDQDEHVLLGALREVREETGCDAVLGPPLGELRYRSDGLPKRVRYWAMRSLGGLHRGDAEVDEVAWLPADRALARLDPDHDRPILERFLADPAPTEPWVLVRHASAGSRARWHAADDRRPLDARGQRQAQLLGRLLAAYRPGQLWSADLTRCRDTAAPLAARLELRVQAQPLLSERAWADSRAQALGWAARAARAASRAQILFSQGGPVPELAVAVAEALGGPAPAFARTRKGGFVVLHLAGTGVRAAEAFEPPA